MKKTSVTDAVTDAIGEEPGLGFVPIGEKPPGAKAAFRGEYELSR